AAGVDGRFVTHLCRRDDDSPSRLLTGLATGFVHGMDVDWGRLLPGTRTVPLPTYAFQHERFWLGSGVGGVRDVAALGQREVWHALLGAEVSVAGTGGLVLTGRVSVGVHGWLAGLGVVPSSALVDLALYAGGQVGCAVVSELKVVAPLWLPDEGGVQIQITVGSGGEGREFGIYSREGDESEWRSHAHGRLASEASQVMPEWRSGDVDVEVVLPEEASAEGFVVHPVLLDAALQAAFAGAGEDVAAVEFSDVRVSAVGARSVRVRARRAGDGSVAVMGVDPAGAEVFAIRSVIARPVEARPGRDVFHVDWTRVPGVGAGQEAVGWSVVGLGAGEGLVEEVERVC
ncbi:polyketide synthase dehydratase domain-containing protein, partial [Streptomyces sp. NPDC058051]|uniref:polyketide synthase dehydratase domain-containing protein n=1 Tax=Streptomyces sp. NPDC058051 TaxID=3346315 RepID=UPI0036E40B17